MKLQKTKDNFLQMRSEGHSFQAIANELNISKQTLIEWSKEFTTELQNIKTIRIEAIYNRFALTKDARITFMGEMIERVKSELDTRDLTKVGTERLFDIILKLSDALDKERESLVFVTEPDFCQRVEQWPA